MKNTSKGTSLRNNESVLEEQQSPSLQSLAEEGKTCTDGNGVID
ncbi:hypothetical protein [Anoxybacillus eryuanensis]